MDDARRMKKAEAQRAWTPSNNNFGDVSEKPTRIDKEKKVGCLAEIMLNAELWSNTMLTVHEF